MYLLIFSGQRSRPVRSTAGTRLAAAIAVEKLDEFENPVRSSRWPQSLKHKTSVKRKHAIMVDADTDVDDTDFTASAEDGSDDASNAMEISNEEV